MEYFLVFRGCRLKKKKLCVFLFQHFVSPNTFYANGFVRTPTPICEVGVATLIFSINRLTYPPPHRTPSSVPQPSPFSSHVMGHLGRPLSSYTHTHNYTPFQPPHTHSRGKKRFWQNTFLAFRVASFEQRNRKCK